MKSAATYAGDFPAEPDDDLSELRAEVERLKADRDSWKRMYDIAEARADKAEADHARVASHFRVDL